MSLTIEDINILQQTYNTYSKEELIDYIIELRNQNLIQQAKLKKCQRRLFRLQEKVAYLNTNISDEEYEQNKNNIDYLNINDYKMSLPSNVKEVKGIKTMKKLTY